MTVIKNGAFANELKPADITKIFISIAPQRKTLDQSAY